MDPEIAEQEELDRQRKELEKQLERLKEQAVMKEGLSEPAKAPSIKG